MADVMTPTQRSRCMSRIRSKNTKPEMRIRKLAHSLGYRFRLYRKDLPGNPDLVFPRRRKIVFVHGCFWHRHFGCRDASIPKSRREYWDDKFARNVARDVEAQQALLAAGWKVLVIWECQISDLDALQELLIGFLGPPGSTGDTGPFAPTI